MSAQNVAEFIGLIQDLPAHHKRAILAYLRQPRRLWIVPRAPPLVIGRC